jgi:hypothetical protein
MKDIQQVLRRKRAQHAQLAKEIQLLQDVEEKLLQVSALLADDDDNGNLLADAEEENQRPGVLAATASSAPSPQQQQVNVPVAAPRTTVPRWP